MSTDELRTKYEDAPEMTAEECLAGMTYVAALEADLAQLSSDNSDCMDAAHKANEAAALANADNERLRSDLAAATHGMVTQELAEKMQADLAAARAEVERLRVIALCAELLVTKLREVHADERYQGVWFMAHAHLGDYEGPQYKAELDALDASFRHSPHEPTP